MKITSRMEVEVVTDVRCDVCNCSTRLDSGNLEYGVLLAYWGDGASHEGARYEVHLCEGCFFGTLAYLRQERRIETMFDDTAQAADVEFGFREWPRQYQIQNAISLSSIAPFTWISWVPVIPAANPCIRGTPASSLHPLPWKPGNAEAFWQQLSRPD